MLELDGMDTFINEKVLSQQEKYVCKEPCQGLSESPDMYNVMDQ